MSATHHRWNSLLCGSLLWLLVVAAGAAEVPPPSERCVVPDGFFFEAGMDLPGNDIKNLFEELSFLAAACDKTPGCIAVNTLGWMKHTLVDKLTDFQGGACAGLLVKKASISEEQQASSDCPQPAPAGYVLVPGKDSPGRDIGRISVGLQTLADACNASPNCTAANTAGWVKKTPTTDLPIDTTPSGSSSLPDCSQGVLVKKQGAHSLHEVLTCSSAPSSQHRPFFLALWIILAFVLIAMSTALAVLATWPRAALLPDASRMGGNVLDASAGLAGMAMGIIGMVQEDFAACLPDVLVIEAVVLMAAVANGSVWLWTLPHRPRFGGHRGIRCRSLVRCLLALFSTAGVVMAAISILQKTVPSLACSLKIPAQTDDCSSTAATIWEQIQAVKPAWMLTPKHNLAIVCVIVCVQVALGLLGMCWLSCNAASEDRCEAARVKLTTLHLGWGVVCVSVGAVVFGIQSSYLTAAQTPTQFGVVVAAVVVLALVALVLSACLWHHLGLQSSRVNAARQAIQRCLPGPWADDLTAGPRQHCSV